MKSGLALASVSWLVLKVVTSQISVFIPSTYSSLNRGGATVVENDGENDTVQVGCPRGWRSGQNCLDHTGERLTDPLLPWSLTGSSCA